MRNHRGAELQSAAADGGSKRGGLGIRPGEGRYVVPVRHSVKGSTKGVPGSSGEPLMQGLQSTSTGEWGKMRLRPRSWHPVGQSRRRPLVPPYNRPPRSCPPRIDGPEVHVHAGLAHRPLTNAIAPSRFVEPLRPMLHSPTSPAADCIHRRPMMKTPSLTNIATTPANPSDIWLVWPASASQSPIERKRRGRLSSIEGVRGG